jgi:hypothetical protein
MNAWCKTLYSLQTLSSSSSSNSLSISSTHICPYSDKSCLCSIVPLIQQVPFGKNSYKNITKSIYASILTLSADATNLLAQNNASKPLNFSKHDSHGDFISGRYWGASNQTIKANWKLGFNFLNDIYYCKVRVSFRFCF